MAECREAVSLFVSLHRLPFLLGNPSCDCLGDFLLPARVSQIYIVDIEVIAKHPNVLVANTFPLGPIRVLLAK